MPVVILCGGPSDGVTLDMDYYALLDAPTYTQGLFARTVTHNYYTWDDPDIGIALYQEPTGRGY